MDIIERLSHEIDAYAARHSGVYPSLIVLPGRLYYELKRELLPLLKDGYLSPDNPDVLLFGGTRVEKRRPSIYCHGCGAPAEPNVCSYCARPSELIELS